MVTRVKPGPPCETVTPGDSSMKSLRFTLPLFSRSLPENTEMDCGTSRADCLRLLAVTTTSSIWVGAAVVAGAAEGAGAGAAAAPSPDVDWPHARLPAPDAAHAIAAAARKVARL